MQNNLLLFSIFFVFLIFGCSDSPCPKGLQLNQNGVCIKPSTNNSTSVSSTPVKEVPESPVKEVPESPVKEVPESPVKEVPESPVKKVPESPVKEVKRISEGEYSLFSDIKINQNKTKGIEAFKAKNYPEAIKHFSEWRKEQPQNPEALIFYNNALALQQEKIPFSLAVVVPINSRTNPAKEILRGVAQAQNKFNSAQGIKNRFLKIVIANDGNEQKEAKKIAANLIKDSSILGVIGHNSSTATEAALEVYSQANLDLAIISPTSTSTFLSNKVFFRTVPSDKQTGEKLAQYIRNNLKLSRVVIFYNSESYSNSLTEAFKRKFEELGGNVLTKEFREIEPDITSGYQNLVTQDPRDAVILFPGSDYTSKAIQIAEANLKLPKANRVPLFGADSLYSGTTLTGGKESVENMILAVPWFSKSQSSKNFSELAKNLWSGGQVNWRTAMSFDATKAFIETFSEDFSRTNTIKQLKDVTISSNETSGKIVQFNTEGERIGKDSQEIQPVIVQIREGGIRPSGSKFGYHLLE